MNDHPDQRETIVRYSAGERTNHWVIALAFLLAGLSGLALFHPALFFLSHLFGGGSWTRILHPFLGLLMVLAFASMAVRFWRHNTWRREDTEWVRNAGQLVRGHEDRMPAVGKYNAGQKGVFWLFGICLVVLLATGFIFWRPYLAPYFPITLVRLAVLLHALAAVVLVLAAIVHIYAAIWVRGSVRAMTRGRVSPAWAAQHHPLWYRQLRAGERPGAGPR